MAFVRVKTIKGNRYGYLVENTWKGKGSRQTVKAYLESQHLGVQVSEASSAELGVPLAFRIRPQLVLMDLRLPGMNGIEAADRIKAKIPECTIIILTMFDTESFKQIFQSASITAYVVKSELSETLTPIIRNILIPQNS